MHGTEDEVSFSFSLVGGWLCTHSPFFYLGVFVGWFYLLERSNEPTYDPE